MADSMYLPSLPYKTLHISNELGFVLAMLKDQTLQWCWMFLPILFMQCHSNSCCDKETPQPG
jgi:hypothetical protein